jgi:hypothetical protein
MPRKKQQGSLMMYVTQSGGYIAGEEVQPRNGTTLLVKDPVFVSPTPDGTGFDLKPVQFIAPTESFRMYAYGLLGDVPMPAGIIPWFRKYQERRAAQQQNMP